MENISNRCHNILSLLYRIPWSISRIVASFLHGYTWEGPIYFLGTRALVQMEKMAWSNAWVPISPGGEKANNLTPCHAARTTIAQREHQLHVWKRLRAGLSQLGGHTAKDRLTPTKCTANNKEAQKITENFRTLKPTLFHHMMPANLC